MALEQPRARVPAQDRLVVAGRADRLGLLVPLHRVAQPVVGQVAEAELRRAQLRLRQPLAHDARVVGLAVRVAELRQQLARALGPRAGRLRELVGDREQSVTSACWFAGSSARMSRQMLSAELGSLIRR
jgi:hypothetical protein